MEPLDLTDELWINQKRLFEYNVNKQLEITIKYLHLRNTQAIFQYFYEPARRGNKRF